MDVKTKFNAVVVVVMLILVSGFIASMGSKTVTISDTQNTSCTWITNSLGDISNATNQSELQRLIWRLNSSGGGWVDGGMNNVSLSSTVYITSNVELKNIKLWQNNYVNKTMIKNQGSYGYTGGSASAYPINYNIRLTNVILNGNCYNQPTWYPGNNVWTPGNNGISFMRTSNIFLDHVTFNNISFACIYLSDCNFSMIRDSNFNNWGGRYFVNESTIAAGHEAYFSNGIIESKCQNFTITGCHFNHGYSGAIIIETIYPYDYKNNSRNGIIDDCIMNSCHFGVYFEDARNVIVSNCIATNISRPIFTTPQQPPSAFLANGCENIKFYNCDAYYCGNKWDETAAYIGYSFTIGGTDGNNNSVVNCNSYNGYGYGFGISGKNVRIENCGSYNDGHTGIYGDGGCLNPIVVGNIVEKSGGTGISISGTKYRTNMNAVISNNIINNSVNNGIYCTLYNFTMNGNSISNVLTGTNKIGIWVYSAQYGTINSNKITKTTFGIFVSGGTPSNISIGNNYISDFTTGIRLGDDLLVHVSNISINNNRINKGTTGIQEGTYNKNIQISHNNILGCTTKIIVTGNITVRDNIGYVTEKWGNATITAGAVSVVVTHALASVLPYYVQVTPCSNITSSVSATASQFWWVSAETLTTFTINIHYKCAANVNFQWYAKV